MACATHRLTRQRLVNDDGSGASELTPAKP